MMEDRFPKETRRKGREAWAQTPEIYGVLEKYMPGCVEQQENDKNKPGFVKRTPEDMEADARAKVMRVMDRYYEEAEGEIKLMTTRFNHVCTNDRSQAMDPHTDYFAARRKKAVFR